MAPGLPAEAVAVLAARAKRRNHVAVDVVCVRVKNHAERLRVAAISVLVRVQYWPLLVWRRSERYYVAFVLIRWVAAFAAGECASEKYPGC